MAAAARGQAGAAAARGAAEARARGLVKMLAAEVEAEAARTALGVAGLMILVATLGAAVAATVGLVAEAGATASPPLAEQALEEAAGMQQRWLQRWLRINSRWLLREAWVAWAAAAWAATCLGQQVVAWAEPCQVA